MLQSVKICSGGKQMSRSNLLRVNLEQMSLGEQFLLADP